MWEMWHNHFHWPPLWVCRLPVSGWPQHRHSRRGPSRPHLCTDMHPVLPTESTRIHMHFQNCQLKVHIHALSQLPAASTHTYTSSTASCKHIHKHFQYSNLQVHTHIHNQHCQLQVHTGTFSALPAASTHRYAPIHFQHCQQVHTHTLPAETAASTNRYTFSTASCKYTHIHFQHCQLQVHTHTLSVQRAASTYWDIFTPLAASASTATQFQDRQLYRHF